MAQKKSFLFTKMATFYLWRYSIFPLKKNQKSHFFPFFQLETLKNNFFHLSIIAGIEPCAVGSTVEVLINPHHAAKPELLEVSLF